MIRAKQRHCLHFIRGEAGGGGSAKATKMLTCAVAGGPRTSQMVNKVAHFKTNYSEQSIKHCKIFPLLKEIFINLNLKNFPSF